MNAAQKIRDLAANGLTNAQIAEIVGVSAGSVRMVMSRARRSATAQHATVAALRTAETAQHVTVAQDSETPAANEPPGVSKPDWITVVFRLLYGTGIIAHAGLIWHECKYLWGDAGAIAGAVVGIVIAGAVVLMIRDNHKEQAENLLWFVWFLDGAAWFVHKAALYHQGTNAYGAGITELGTGCLAAIICLCAMALAYFYKQTAK